MRASVLSGDWPGNFTECLKVLQDSSHEANCNPRFFHSEGDCFYGMSVVGRFIIAMLT